MTTPASLAYHEKTSVERLDYDIDYGKWLTDGDVISSASATIDDPLASFVVDSVEVTEQIVRVWVGGGIHGEASEISVVASTVVGRTKEARFELQIRDD